jgi:predicted MFS family arabinose efflux permease
MLKSWISRNASQSLNTIEYDALRINQAKITTVIRLLAIAIALMVIMTAISSGLTLTVLKKFFEKESAENHDLVCENLQARLMQELHKDNNISSNLFSILEDAKKDLVKLTETGITINRNHSSSLNYASEMLLSVSLVSDSGKIRFSTDRQLLNKEILFNGTGFWKLTEKENSSSFKKEIFSNGNNRYVVFPIDINNHEDIAKIVITLQKNMPHPSDSFLQSFIFLFSLFGIVALGFYLVYKIFNSNHSDTFYKTNITRPVFLIVIATQIACIGVLLVEAKIIYFNLIKTRSEYLVMKLDDKIHLLVNSNIPSHEQENELQHIVNRLKQFKEIDNLIVKDTNDKVIHNVSSTGKVDKQSVNQDGAFNHNLILSRDGTNKGMITINISRTQFYKTFSTLILDLITIIVITFIFSIELIILLSKYLEGLLAKFQLKPKFHYSIVRPAIFLFLFGIDLSMSFLPLHMEKIYQPLFGLSKDLVMGLPVSIEFLCVGIAILISGIWLDRRGWYEPLLYGLLLASVGMFYSWLAPDALHFILSRAVVGIGYGLALMATQGCVINNSDESNKGQALAYWIGGIYAGSLCGGAIGAFCAEWFNYRMVFLGGALILLTVIVYTLAFMKNANHRTLSHKKNNASYTASSGSLKNFLCNRDIISLIFFSSLPAAIAAVGFLNYFSPVYLNRIGVSQSTIGQIIMIYGICVIYIGPTLGKLIDATINKRLFIFVGCLIGGLAFLTFNILNGIIAAIIAVSLLGLSNSIVITSQSTYALQLRVTKELGEGTALGIFRSTSRIGQMLGPLIFSGLIMTSDVEKSITFFGLFYLITALFFLLISTKNN